MLWDLMQRIYEQEKIPTEWRDSVIIPNYKEKGDEQFDFMPGRRRTDAIFRVRQLMEKHREKQKGLHLAFVDLEKAYDRVPRQEVWINKREKGVPEKYVKIVRDMYEDARTRVKSSVGLTDKIPVSTGPHQGSS